MYFPFESNPGQQITLFVRTTPDPALAAAPVRAALKLVEPAIAFQTVRTLADVAGESLRVTELVLWLLGVFAACAVLLAAIGIYGVMSYAVRQRTREIGTRMAVGATRTDIALMVLRQGALIAGTGIGAGLLIGVVATRSLKSVLFGVSASDPLTIGGAVVVLGTAVLVACLIPARRASIVDPARTLAQN
jgi:putative ABC transport system permease protein